MAKIRMCSCIICRKEFSMYGINTHFICAHEGKNQYRPKNKTDAVAKFKKMTEDRNIEMYGEFKLHPVVCAKCGKPFDVLERQKLHPQKDKYHCSISCWNSRGNRSEETKLKIKQTLFKKNQQKYKAKGQDKIITDDGKILINKICTICGKQFQIRNTQIITTCSKMCYAQLPKKTTRQPIKDTSRMGGARDGGGYSKVIPYTNRFGETMKLNREEIIVATHLDMLGVNWCRNTVGFPYITLDGKNRKYYPDFYVIDYDVYVEYKGWITDKMAHKMNKAVDINGLSLVIVYGDSKRYRDLGLNTLQIKDNPMLLLDAVKINSKL